MKLAATISGLAGLTCLTALAVAQQPQGPAGGIVAMPEVLDGPTGTVGRIAKFTSATALGNSVIRETSTGRIGIGINPVSGLTLKTPSSSNGFIHTDGTVQVGTFAGTYRSVTGSIIGNVTNHPLQFSIGGDVKMRIDPDGNVGIGAQPQQSVRLDVSRHTDFHAAVRGLVVGEGSIGLVGVGTGTAAIGVSGSAIGTGSRAGKFNGAVQVVGTLSKSAGAFRIDHPVEPARKYLSHSFVESPDMLNIYNGNAILDADGRAEVTLPGYFHALNRDFRYTLTAIGAPALVYVASEIADSRFTIAGGTPGLKVSWMVTGIRQDAYANAHRIPNEEAKPAHEMGLYLHPDVHGEPASKGVDYARMQLLGRGQPSDTAAATTAVPGHQAALAR